MSKVQMSRRLDLLVIEEESPSGEKPKVPQRKPGGKTRAEVVIYDTPVQENFGLND